MFCWSNKFSKNKTQNEKYNINMEIENAQINKKFEKKHYYGDGKTAEKIVKVLREE